MKKNLLVILACVLIALVVISCDDPKHEHSYGTEWKYDDTNHWHECSCGAKIEEAKHTLEWTESKDGTKHYQKCTVCEYKTEEVAHTYGDWGKADDTHVKRTCDECGHVEKADGSVVSTAAELKTAIEAEGEKTIYLTKDLAIAEDITINKGQNITLNLNGKNITFDTKRFVISALSDGKGGSLTVEGSGKIYKAPTAEKANNKDTRAVFKIDGDTNASKTENVPCKLTIGKDVEIEGPCAIWVPANMNVCFDVDIDIYGTVKGYEAILVNGNTQDSTSSNEKDPVEINIHDGARILGTTDQDTIYLPGYTKTTIGKAEITAYTDRSALVIGRGELTINGATISCGTTFKKITGEQGGMDSLSCSAIYVNQNTIDSPIKVTIKDGTFSGYFPFYYDQGRNSNSQKNKVILSIEGGTFKNIVTVENEGNTSASVKTFETSGYTKFIKGGTFSTDPTNYLVDGYKAEKDTTSGIWTVKSST